MEGQNFANAKKDKDVCLVTTIVELLDQESIALLRVKYELSRRCATSATTVFGIGD